MLVVAQFVGGILLFYVLALAIGLAHADPYESAFLSACMFYYIDIFLSVIFCFVLGAYFVKNLYNVATTSPAIAVHQPTMQVTTFPVAHPVIVQAQPEGKFSSEDQMY